MDAFDSDVLIYAVIPGHPLGRRIAPMFTKAARTAQDPPDGLGSVLLLPEVLGKPLRDGATAEVAALSALLSRLDLRPLDRAGAELATAMCATYRLRAADAAHLATAVSSGADRFITNNQKDFPKNISDIEIVYPEDLPDGP